MRAQGNELAFDGGISTATKAFILFSFVLVLHIGFAYLPSTWFLKEAPPKVADAIPVEKFIEVITDESRQVVRSSKVIDQEENTDTPKFLSEFKNRVKEETRARLSGRFREDLQYGGASLPGLGEDFQKPGPWGIPSQSPDKLPDGMKEGANTILNTDPVVYASFMNRIADQLYEPWRKMVHDALGELSLRDVRLSNNNIYETKLSVVLDRSGDIRSIQVIDSAGYDLLDEAAKQAFWENEPFLNPPSQLFKKDKDQVKLDYSFNVEMKSWSLNILPVPM